MAKSLLIEGALAQNGATANKITSALENSSLPGGTHDLGRIGSSFRPLDPARQFEIEFKMQYVIERVMDTITQRVQIGEIQKSYQESVVHGITDALDSDRITMDDIAVATSVARKLDLSKPILLSKNLTIPNIKYCK